VPQIAEISHVSLTVADMGRTKQFWTEVMGCNVVMEESDFCLCVEPRTGLPISFKDHDGTVSGAFDESSVGLDHLALAVSDRDELERWRDWLDDHGVPQSGITETDLGHHLNLRAPDNIAIELFAIKPHVAEALGLGR
jgi:glyoxylase I family protein